MWRRGASKTYTPELLHVWSEAYEDAEGAKVNPAWYTKFHRDGSEPGVLIKDLDEVIRDDQVEAALEKFCEQRGSTSAR